MVLATAVAERVAGEEQVGREGAAAGLTAARAMGTVRPDRRPGQLVADGAAQAAPRDAHVPLRAADARRGAPPGAP